MELLALLSLAVVAGAVSFSSPCVLPLLPGYVSYVCGLSGPHSVGSVGSGGSESGSAPAVWVRRRVRLGAGLFVAGFATVFTVLGATASVLGLVLRQNLQVITLVGGAAVVILGLAMTGLVRIGWLHRQVRFDLSRIGTGPAGAFPLGAVFAFGWTPCVGPVLASVLTTAASTADPWRGVVLLLGYSLGLGLPFLILAGGLSRGRDRFRWLRRHARRVEVGGGIALMVTGVLMMTGGWTVLMSGTLAFYARLGWPPI